MNFKKVKKIRKVDITILLAFTLLVVMLGIGMMSAFLAFFLGDEALKGVSQPDTNPTKNLTDNQLATERSQTLTFLDEKSILIEVDHHIRSKSQQSNSKAEKKPKDLSNQLKSVDQSESSLQAKFPLSIQDGGVIFEVTKASQREGALILEVNLTNQGKKVEQFLYSFLEVTNDQGQSLGSIVEGLPDELPANGEKFSGTIKVPEILNDQSQKLSLSLTDYPDQKLKLKISNILVLKEE
jgi:hypothetical protein